VAKNIPITGRVVAIPRRTAIARVIHCKLSTGSLRRCHARDSENRKGLLKNRTAERSTQPPTEYLLIANAVMPTTNPRENRMRLGHARPAMKKGSWRNQAFSQACAVWSPKSRSMSGMAILRQFRRGRSKVFVLCNFEQTLDCQYRHDICEQTSGEGCSANVPIRKSLGRFVFGKNVYNRVSPSLLWRDAMPHFKKRAILSRHPIRHGVN
jgi:hypothetical protein